MPSHHPDLSRAVWRTSSRSSTTGQNCVEVATNLPGIVMVRDSKEPGGPVITIDRTAWVRFITQVKR